MTLRILIVDDDPAARSLIRESLARDAGMQVVGEAEDGARGVELAASLAPDVVLMDLSLGEMHGLEAARRIRQERPQAAILLVTSYGYEELGERAREAGHSVPYTACVGKQEVAQRLAPAIRAAVQQRG
jgi:NarL family two-component system response regulator LiaR